MNIKYEYLVYFKIYKIMKPHKVSCLFRNLQKLVFLLMLVWTSNDYFYVAGSMNVENLAGSS